MRIWETRRDSRKAVRGKGQEFKFRPMEAPRLQVLGSSVDIPCGSKNVSTGNI